MFGVSQNEVLENSVKSLTDELQDVRAERDVFQQKAHRLNVEMNHIVGNDEVRILDIDALCMENRLATLFEEVYFSVFFSIFGCNCTLKIFGEKNELVTFSADMLLVNYFSGICISSLTVSKRKSTY